MSLNQTSENSSSFSASGSFLSNFKTVSSVNLTKENSYDSYNRNNGLSDKYFSFAYLPVEEDAEKVREDSCDCIERINELDRKYKKLFQDLTQKTKKDAAELCRLSKELGEKASNCENLKQELESMYANAAKQREELDNLRRENEMLRLNYNNIDESILGYHQCKTNLDNMAATLSAGTHLAPGLYNQQYKNKSTGQLNMINRHNSVVLSDLNVMTLNKYRNEHHSHHHLHPTPSSFADTRANRDESCASADDLGEKVQLETSDKKKGLLSRIRCRLDRRKTFKA